MNRLRFNFGLKRRHHFAIWTVVIVVYMVGLLLGLGYIRWRHADPNKPSICNAWRAPNPAAIPDTMVGDRIRYGRRIFTDTPEYAKKYTGGALSCSNCHVDGGIAPYGLPVVGVTSRYPRYSRRADRVISLQDRIRGCFVRSENGRPLPDNSPEMEALIAYMAWLSRPEKGHLQFTGQDLVELPHMLPNRKRGARIYAGQCAGCHGENGTGSMQMMPPLWGPDSFNDGAGMGQVSEMARFVQHNMPQNRRGILSAQDAYDVSAYIDSRQRPKLDPKYKTY